MYKVLLLIHVWYCSTWQLDEHPSKLIAFPSSQPYDDYSKPLPQLEFVVELVTLVLLLIQLLPISIFPVAHTQLLL